MQTDAVQKLITSRYAAAHGAVPSFDYPHFCVVGSTPSAPAAALGFRLANEGRLFLETYLDQPVDHLLSERFGRPIGRDHIVEIGAHASEKSHATIALWAQTARHLDGQAEFAVAVITAPLRAMFDRLGIAITELAAADPARLPCGGKDWGRYYATTPMVCAGLIAPARQRLAAFADRFSGSCA